MPSQARQTYTADHLQALIACPDCDLLHHRHVIPEGGRADCTRCGAVLYRHQTNSIERTVAWTITALAVFLVANLGHFMSFILHGRVQSIHAITGVYELYAGGAYFLAPLILWTSIVAPAVTLLLLLYLCLPVYLGYIPWGMGRAYRIYSELRPWGMVSVFFLGSLVAIIKLADLAQTPLGLGFWAVVVLMFVVVAAQSRLDPHMLWLRLEAAQREAAK